jgi:hypothetical protein
MHRREGQADASGHRPNEGDPTHIAASLIIRCWLYQSGVVANRRPLQADEQPAKSNKPIARRIRHFEQPFEHAVDDKVATYADECDFPKQRCDLPRRDVDVRDHRNDPILLL